MIEKPTSWLAALWFGSGSVTLLVQASFNSWMQQANTLILTIGGTLILLYQRKLSADRTLETNGNYSDLKSRIEDLASQRDREQIRADKLFDQINHLTELFEKHRCIFPLADGTPRCAGRDTPPLFCRRDDAKDPDPHP